VPVLTIVVQNNLSYNIVGTDFKRGAEKYVQMSGDGSTHASVLSYSEPPVGIGHAKPGSSGCYATLPRARCPSFLRLILYRAGSAGWNVNKHRDRYYQGRRRGVPPSSHGQPAVLAFFALEKACEDGGKDLCVERRREYGPRGGKAFAS
jgi:hypothetical protein